MKKKFDFNQSPLLVFYEVTQACDLVCKHCRASAQTSCHPNQLDPQQALALVDQIAQFPTPPLLVITGGDPLKRTDLYQIIKYAKSKDLTVAITPSATPLLTTDTIDKLKDAGIDRMALSLDSHCQKTHDSFRGLQGSFNKTIQALQYANQIGISLQINTTVTADNAHQIDDIANWLTDKNIDLWSVFFLIQVGRGNALKPIAPQTYETLFQKLLEHAAIQPYAIKTTEAHHYRRYVLQQGAKARKMLQNTPSDRIHRSPLGVNDGNGVMFVSHTGEIYPSGFMPIHCGTFPQQSIIQTYQNHPQFTQLRKPKQYQGKCGQCQYTNICGGSRARAYAATGNPTASDPDCVYIPPKWEQTQAAIAKV